MRSAATVSDATRNHLFDRPILPTKIVKQKNKKSDPKERVFHQFAADIQECFIVVGIEDATETRRRNNLGIEKQRKAGVLKDESKK